MKTSLVALAILSAVCLASQTGCTGVYAVAPAPAVYAPPPTIVAWTGAGWYGGTYYSTRTAYYSSSYYRSGGAYYRGTYNSGG